MRRIAMLLASIFVATAVVVGVSAVDPRAAEAATVSVKGCTGTAVKMSTVEKKMLDLHNEKRASKGLRKLCVHPALQRAARAHSKDMIERDYFAHGNVGKRLKKFGYNWRTYGENIAYGSGSQGAPGPIFKAWMNSDGHRTNILSKKFREVGVGAAKGNYKGISNVTMWTVDFGDR